MSDPWKELDAQIWTLILLPFAVSAVLVGLILLVQAVVR